MSNAETGPKNEPAALQADEPGDTTTPSPIVTMAPDADSRPAVMTADDGHEAGIGTATVVVDDIRVSYRAPSTVPIRYSWASMRPSSQTFPASAMCAWAVWPWG